VDNGPEGGADFRLFLPGNTPLGSPGAPSSKAEEVDVT